MLAIREAPNSGLIIVAGRTLQTIERNLIDPLQDPALFGEIAFTVQHTRGSNVAVILGRTVHLIGANDARSEGRLRGLTACLGMIDEATLVPKAFFTQFLARLSVPGARMLLTTNPDGPAHWLRKDFIQRASELDLAHFHFTLDDNPSLAPEYVKAIKAEFTGLWFKRMVLGQWVSAEGAVYDMWDPDKHVIDLIPPIWRWICASVDYGTSNPLHALLLGIDASQTIYVASEWRHSARDTRRSMTDAEYSAALKRWLAEYRPPAAHAQGVTPEAIVVDPSAASFIEQLWRDRLTPTPADNSVGDGIRLVSSLMSAGKLKVHRSCQNLIDEIPGYSWDEKKSARGEDAPIKVDDHGCFAAGTPVLTNRGAVAIEMVTTEDQVLTRAGWRPVLAAEMTSAEADTFQVELSSGASLVGTGNHPIWVASKGWVRLDALRYGDRLDACPSELTLSSSEGSNSGATPTPRRCQNSGTTFPASPTGNAVSNACTKRSGCRCTEKFRSDITSTTSTATHSTTIPPTWNASPRQSTKPAMRPTGTSQGSITVMAGLSTLSPSGHSQRLGTDLMRVEPGTKSTDGTHGSDANTSRMYATNVKSPTSPGVRKSTIGSAPTSASRSGGEPPASTTKTAPVNDAAEPSALTDTTAPGSADVRVLGVVALHGRQPVWNLAVAEHPEFYAAGVLVHNCDALRYGVKTTESAWRRPQAPMIRTTGSSEPDFMSVAL